MNPIKKTIIRRKLAENYLSETNLHPLLKNIYTARGIKQIADLEQGLEKLLPFSELRGMDQAVACLYRALQQKQHIIILGDFDADGATSAALAVSMLCAMGAAKVSYLVPNRFEYGYGLTPEIVKVAAQRRPDVLVTVDNGISSI